MALNRHIHSVSLAEDVRALRCGDRSLEQLLERIETRFNETESAIEAFLPESDRFLRLRRDATALDPQYPEPGQRPPLYGALLGVKDIFHVNGFTTRAGTEVPVVLFAGEEAGIVARFKRAGALILGKTVSTEFAYFEPGPTRNPHNLAHTPGGSSSGSAAAVASGLVHFALGTQTVGSVIRPAAYCGIVGFKPSYKRVDSSGLVTFSLSADHVGFFTQSVDDMQRVAAVAIDDWNQNMVATGKPVLAVPDGAYLKQCSALNAFEAELEKLVSAGYHIKRVNVLQDIAEIDSFHQDMIAAELAAQHQEWFAWHASLYRPRTAELIRYGQTIATERLQEARQHRLRFRQLLHDVMSAHKIDAWICPAAPDVAPSGISATGDPKMNMPWTHSGLPAATVPAGTGNYDLPLGLQLVSKFHDDESLLHWAGGIEACFRQ